MTVDVSAGRSSARGSRYALVVAGEIVLAIALLAGATVFAEAQATEHARVHAAVGLAVLLLAGLILRARPKPSVASRAPVIGLMLFAGAQLMESLGALGYGPDNDTRRNGLAVAHDVGVLATGLALLALVVAIAIGVGALTSRRSGRGILVPSVVALAIVAAGLIVLARMIGF